MGELCHAGTAPGAPKVDNGNFADGGGINILVGEAVGGDDRQAATGQQVAGFVAGLRGAVQCAEYHIFQIAVAHGLGELGQHDAVFVDDHGVGVVAQAAQGQEVGTVCVILGEDNGGVRVVFSDEAGSVLTEQVGVDGDDGDLVGVFFCDLVKVGELCHAGTAPGTPEIDDGNLAGGSGVDGVIGEAVGGDDRQAATGQQVAGLVTRLGGGTAGRGGNCGFRGLRQVGGGIPVVGNSTDQHGQHHDAGDDTGDQPLIAATGFGGFHFLRIGLHRAFIGCQENLGTLPGDSLGGANINAIAAGDAFLVAYMLDVYLALGHAEIAMGALCFVHLDTEDGNLVKQAVQTTQRAEETAEHAVNEHTANHDAHHQHEFPGEQGAQHGEETVVDLVGKQQQAALNGTCGADVLAECGGGGLADGVGDGHHQHEEHQNHIFQEGKNPGDRVFLQLGGLDLVQQVLNQTEGTQPAADHAAEQNGVQQQNAAYIQNRRGPVVKGTLQGTQRAGGDGAGAGVAVDAGSAEEFCALGVVVNFSGNEALDIGVEQQREVQLHNSALGGHVLFDK